MTPPRSYVEDDDSDKTSSTTCPNSSRVQPFGQTANNDEEVTHTRDEAATILPEETANQTTTGDLQAGATLGRYIILARLGAGSMGVVYSAFDPGLDRKIALKLVKGTRSRKKATEHARLLREARALARLNHANVVTVHETGEVSGIFYLAMEYIDGQTLGQWQRSNSSNKRFQSWREIVDVYVQAGQGLAAAHRAQLIHRDFKPDNVMLDTSGRVCVLDFGIAYPMVHVRNKHQQESAETLRGIRSEESSTWTSPSDVASRTGSSNTPTESTNGQSLEPKPNMQLSEDAVALTRIGSVIGTPAYMAPEQLYGDAANAKSDQFSFCVALYEALYGRRPYKGNSPAVLVGQVNTGVVLFPASERRIPRRLRNLITRGLSVDPKSRFGSMDELISELRKIRSSNRRSLAIVCGISLAAAGAVIGYNWTDHNIAGCRDAEAELNQIWNPSQRKKIADHFSKTKAQFALGSLEAVNKLLDDYSKRWLSIHQDTCQSVHQAGLHGLENQSLKLVCLSRRLRSFSTLIQQLLYGDPSVMEHAWNASAELSALESCNSAKMENLGSTPPSDPASLRIIHELESELAELSILIITEQTKKGLERAQKLVERAERQQYLPLIARSEITLAKFHLQNQNFVTAEEKFHSALHHAEVSGDGRTTLLAWLGMMEWYVDSQMNFDRAIEASRHIRALIERFELQEHQENAQFLRLFGEANHYAGHYKQAIDLFNEAMSIYEAHKSPATLRQRWNLILNLGYSHMQNGNAKFALELLNTLLSSVQNTLGKLHPEVARVKAAIGRVYDIMNKDSLALEFQHSAHEIIVNARNLYHPLSAETLENIGSIHIKSGNYNVAFERFNQALSIYQKLHSSPNQPDILRTYLNLGFVTYELRQFSDSIHWCKQALDGFQHVYGARNPRVADALSCRAGGFDLVGQHKEALDDYNQALSILIEILGPKHSRVAVTYEYLGETQWDHKEPHDALKSFRKSKEIWQKILPKDDPDRIYSEVFCEIIENYINERTLPPFEIESIAKRIEWIYSKRSSEVIHQRLLMALEELKKVPSHRTFPAFQVSQIP